MALPVQVCTRAQMQRPQAWAVPVGERWAVISDGLFDALADHPGIERHALVGCACCAGSLALRVTLARLIRRGGYARLLVVVADESHRAGVVGVLTEAQFAPHLVLEVR